MVSSSRSAPDAKDYLLLISLAALFGASFMFTEMSVIDIPPLTIAAGRVLLASVVLIPIMIVKGQRLPPSGPIWLNILAVSLTGYVLPFALISWGQTYVLSSLASIFMAIMPLATIVLAHFFTHDEKLNSWKIYGVLSGLVGVIVLFGTDTLNDLGGRNTIAQLALLAAAFSYAANALLTRTLVDAPRLPILVALLLTSTVLLVPVSLIIDQPWTLNPAYQSIVALVALAIGPTALATLMILVIIDRQSASFLSQINFMVPLFGVLFGWLLLSERISANTGLALLFILIGLGLSRHGNKRPAVSHG
jgi:drug/metabolite transporter (DMT)-like permease